MHIDQRIFIRFQQVKKVASFIPAHQLQMSLIAGYRIQVGEQFHHPAGFLPHHLPHLFFRNILGIADKPFRRLLHYDKRLFISRQQIHIQEACHDLMAYVLWSPGSFSSFQPEQVFFRNWKTPFSTVFLLTPANLPDDLIGSALYHSVLRLGIQQGCRAEPVSAHRSPNHGQRRIPPSMQILRQICNADDSRLMVERQQQVLCRQAHHIFTVFFSAPRQFSFQFYILI